MELETKQIRLRSIRKEDDKDIYSYSRQKHVGPNAGWKPHESIEETREIIKLLFLEKETIWGIIEKDSNKVIGTIGFIDDPKRKNPNCKMVGYAMAEEFWGRGIMTETLSVMIDYGFSCLKLHCISAYCYPFNIGSQKVLEKNGFHYEGTLKMAEILYHGKIYDNRCYLLTKEDYFSHKEI